jgi:PAS domain S-box-containing protein
MRAVGTSYLNLGPRLTLTFITLIVLILGGNTLVVSQFYVTRNETIRLTGANQQLIAVLQLQSELLSFHRRLDDLARSMDVRRLVTETVSLRRDLQARTRQTRTAIANLPSGTVVDPSFLPTLDSIDVILPAEIEAILELAKSGDWGAIQPRVADELNPIETQTAILVNSINQQASENLARGIAEMGSDERRVLVIVSATALSTFFIATFLGWSIALHMIELQEEKFREAVETMPALAFVADPKGNRTFLNRGWLEYTGLSSEQASGSGWLVAVHPDDLKRVTERWRKSQTNSELLDYEARLRRGSDGVYRWFQTRARPLCDNRGKIVKWCAVATDIEDRKRAEQLQANLAHISRVNAMGELVASISHELAQPIMASTVNAQASLRWLQHDPPNLMRVREGTEKIVEAGILASEIIDRLRSLYKKSSPKRELVAINEVVGEMVPLLRSEANEYAVSIRTNLAPDLPKITADRVQLQQVLMNLMLNGVEAMKETGGVLTMKSQLGEDGQIQISIHDTGPGLPLGNAGQIFDAFFTTKPQGSGMGLAISKSIIESHGGRIWANSNGGRGATFHFTLPATPSGA